jgi:hypothetical protein
MKAIFRSNLFLIGGLIILSVGGAQFYSSNIKPRLGL